jgi:F-type H+-transporting ATPase subunit delta
MAAYISRYARAFADVVVEKKLNISEIETQLLSLRALWHQSAELRAAFENPSVSVRQKLAVLDGLNKKLQFNAILRNFVAVLISHGRISALDAMIDAFHAEMQSRAGIQQAEVTTTRELNENERAGLMKGIEKLAGSRVVAKFKMDKSILGGAVVRIGSTVYDGSVKGRLDRLKEILVG